MENVELDSLAPLEEVGLESVEEVLCFIVKDEDAYSVIGGRCKTYIEAKRLQNKFSERNHISIYKVTMENGKHVLTKV